MKSGLLTITLLLVFFVIPSIAFAGDPPRPRFDNCDVPTQAPFDGGLAILLVAGVAYAAKKSYDNRNKNEFERAESEK